MDEDALLHRWVTGKLTRAFRRLRAPVAVEFEFRRQFGHPSSYAYVRLQATPADRLSFESNALWPGDVSPDEARHFERAVVEGLIDVLFAALEPHRGCSVTLTAVRHDAVGSSFAAFHAAAVKAAERLVQEAAWERAIDATHR